jgi:hypothetical protein
MRRSDDVVYPVTQQENGAGNVVMYADPGIDLGTHMSIVFAAALLSRIDGGILNPDEVADRACLQAEAMLRRMP